MTSARKKTAAPERKRRRARNRQIARLFRSGETMESIGNRHGLTRERVRQILKIQFGLSRNDGGKKVALEKRRRHEAALEARA